MNIENVPYNTIGAEATQLVEETMSDVAKAVVPTMGPNGKLALIEVGTSVKTTKDGVTVAKSLKFNDPRKEVVSRVIIEAAVKTDMECGDGTTTTVLLTRLFYDLLAGHQTYLERQFIEGVVNDLIAKLEEMSVEVTLDSELLYPLALTSSNNDHKLAKAVVDIYQGSNGRFPYVEFKEGVDSNDKVLSTDEMVLRMTMANPSFSVHGNGMDTPLTRSMPVVVDSSLASGSQEETNKLALQMAELAKLAGDLRDPKDPLHVLLIARNIDHSFTNVLIGLNAIAANPTHQAYEVYKGLRFIAAQTNMGGSVGTLLMQDLAVVLGGKMYNALDQFFDSKITYVCSERVVLGSQRSTVKLSPEGLTRAQHRVEELQKEVDRYQLGEKFSPKAKFTERRIRDLSGSLVTIFVGGQTQSDIKERIDRFEDVVKAVRSALENGVLPGVGVGMIRAFNEVSDNRYKGVHNGKTFTPQECEIMDKIQGLVSSQYVYLMESLLGVEGGHGIFDDTITQVSMAIQQRLYELKLAAKGMEGDYTPLPAYLVLNLSTGDIGTPEELGVYDTAYASITALKGGFQTAKILASTSSIMLGNKLGGVRV
jgi:chaperonin GroEL